MLVTAFATSGSRLKSTGCGPQPILVMRPLGRTSSSDCLSARLTPVQSTTRSAPTEEPNTSRAVKYPSFLSSA